MPTYSLRNKKTQERLEVFCTWPEVQKILEDDPDLVQMLTTPTIVSGVGSLLSKTDDGWKDNLKRIKAASGKDNTIKV
tara:strand:+ start:960 stop:1193 length:234 start_codon:yes stop_codon:yes gene_type:complete